MSALFGLVFLAALIGVIKPYISGMSREHFGGAAVVAFVLFALTAPDSPTGEKPLSPSPTAASPASMANDDGSGAGKWVYSEDKDEMRGTTTRYAHLKSENAVDLDFPYGTVSGEIWVRKRPEDGLNIMFAVEKGQILCHSFRGSNVAIKFDEGPIQTFRCTGSSDGSSDTAFIEGASRVLAGLKKAKRMVIEAEFFQKGRQQFAFETSGLKWD